MADQGVGSMADLEADCTVDQAADSMPVLEAAYMAARAAVCMEAPAAVYMEGLEVAYTVVQAGAFMVVHHPTTKMHIVGLGDRASLERQTTTGLGKTAPTDVKKTKIF